MRRGAGILRRLLRDEGGAAATEMALWTVALAVPIFNAVDIGFYTYQWMQVDAAAHAAVNSAWHDCNPTATTPAPPPALVSCKAKVSGVLTNMQTAAQSTSLGTGVSLPLASISEGYYCADDTGALTLMTSIGTGDAPPTTAPSVPKCTGTSTNAGDYISATVSFTYTPVFSSASILTMLGTSVTKTAWLRLDK
jgi:Flp pilus assembly protein TadG